MIKITCDLCGSDKNVRAPYVSIWNGLTFDMCPSCSSEELSGLLDKIWLAINQRLSSNDES